MNAPAFPSLYGPNRDAAAIMGVSLAAFMQQPNGLRWHPDAPKPVAVAEGARELQFLPAWIGFAYERAGETPPPYGLSVAYLTAQPVAATRPRGRPRTRPVEPSGAKRGPGRPPKRRTAPEFPRANA